MAEIVTGVETVTVLVVMGNVAIVEPTGMVSVPLDTCAAALLLEIVTAMLAGAGLLSVTMPVGGWPPITLDGIMLTPHDCRDGGGATRSLSRIPQPTRRIPIEEGLGLRAVLLVHQDDLRAVVHQLRL